MTTVNLELIVFYKTFISTIERCCSFWLGVYMYIYLELHIILLYYVTLFYVSNGLDKSSDEINFKKNTTLLSFTDMFQQLPLPSSV